MARKPANTVIVKDFTNIQDEFKASAAGILPGHLVELASATTIKVHATAGGNAVRWFAIEDNLQGKTVDDAYTINEQAQVRKFRAGDEVLAILKDGENVAAGAYLESAGNGELQAHTPDDSSSTIYSNQIVGIAREALDLSDSSGADPSNRIWIEIV